jgi:hypothetical protein
MSWSMVDTGRPRLTAAVLLLWLSVWLWLVVPPAAAVVAVAVVWWRRACCALK